MSTTNDEDASDDEISGVKELIFQTETTGRERLENNDHYPDSPDQCREAELEMEVRLERLRLEEALCARDAVVQRFYEACTSIRQKAASLECLQQEKNELERKVKILTDTSHSISASSSAVKVPEDKKKLAAEVGRLAGMFRKLQDEVVALKRTQHDSRKGDGPSRAEVENMYQETKYDWEVSTNKLLLLLGETASLGVLRDASNDSPKLLSPIFETPVTPYLDVVDWKMQNMSIECGGDGTHRADLETSGPLEPAERIQARNLILATLPLPEETPPDVLRPIVIPSPFTFHDFLGTIPVSLRTQLGNYRVFQQSTTSWCPDREEHGYFLTPIFKCHTNPRVTTAHRWAPVDLTSKLHKPTECFYNKDGKWYYAGVYKAFWLDELSPHEWDGLSTETTQALIKETLAGRKNTSPQNIYETGQLYTAGALKVVSIGLQCIGFNSTVYRTLMEHAANCAQTGKWRNGSVGGGHSPGATWTTPVVPISPNMAPGTLSASDGSESVKDDGIEKDS